MAGEIKIYEFKKMDLRAATIIDGFPSVGLVSSIVANYLINALHLEQIGIMESMHFPTVSLIRNSEPQSPVRIYAGGKEEGTENKVVTFISEFQPPSHLIAPIASAMLDWAEEQRCALIVSPEGLVIDREAPRGLQIDEKTAEKRDVKITEARVYGVASTKKARELLMDPCIHFFPEGVITGVAAVLLNEGRRRDFDVISLLAEAHPGFPDARAAARIIEVICKTLLHTHLDLQPLYEEAERIEAQIKTIHRQSTVAKPKGVPPTPAMYG
jgi:uncharacterized protein